MLPSAFRLGGGWGGSSANTYGILMNLGQRPGILLFSAWNPVGTLLPFLGIGIRLLGCQDRQDRAFEMYPAVRMIEAGVEGFFFSRDPL